MRIYLQTEAAECGLAALAMVASAHGMSLELSELRRKFLVSLKGANLRQLMQHAAALGFSARPLRLDMDELRELDVPSILHWDLNHFVVLKKVTRWGISVLDPAIGERKYSWKEASLHFTGVALELTPNADFKPVSGVQRLRLSQLTGRVRGLKRSLLQILLVALVLQLFALVMPIMNQIIIDDVLTSGDRALLTVVVFGFGLLLICQTLLSLARSWMVMVLSQTLNLQWLSNVFSHLIKLPTAYFERRHLGDVTSRFASVSAIQRTLTTAAIEAVLDGIMALAALAMMLAYNVELAGIVLTAVLLYGLLRWAMYKPFRNAASERLILAAKENSHFLETLRAITALKLFGREHERRVRWQNLVVGVQNRDVATVKMGIIFGTSSTFIFGLENLLVLWFGAKLILDGIAGGDSIFTVGMMFAFVAYKGQFSGRVSALINYVVELKMLGLHAERIADIALESPEEDAVPEHGLEHLSPTIELIGVKFRYADGEPWVLDGVDLKLCAGESVAVTGASGSGKTTLLKIALGLLSPTEGEVLYGGQKIRQIGLTNYRRQIGTVMQEDMLLSGSLAENISFFDGSPDNCRIEECARVASIHQDIINMPMGYQTLVGDLGSGLSGGQKQRLLLARALYKAPKVLVMDEATSHLDISNERSVIDALSIMSLTRLTIAHRPETIASAHRVVELRNGKIRRLPE